MMRTFARWLGFLVSISMIVVGAVYFDHQHCPAEKIALLLILGGAIFLVNSLVSKLAHICRNSSPKSLENSEDSKKLRTESKVTTNSGQVVNFKTTTIVVEEPEDPGNEILETTIEVENHRGCCNVVAVVQVASFGQYVLRCISLLLDLTAFSVFITTCIIVFRLYPNVDYEDQRDTNNYCNPGLFLFAFAYLLVVFSLMIIFVIIFISCRFCCAWFTFSITPTNFSLNPT